MFQSSSKFGRFLVEQGKLTPERVEKAVEMQRLVGGRLGTCMLELGVISEPALLEALGQFRMTQTASADKLREIPSELLKMVPPKLARRYRVVPIEHKGNTLILASTDTGDALVEDEIGMLNGCLARTVIGLEVRVHLALARFYKVPCPGRLAGVIRRLENKAATPAAPAASPSAPPPSLPPAPRPEPPKPPPAPPKTPPPKAPPAAGLPPAEPPIQFIEVDDESLALAYGRPVPAPQPEQEPEPELLTLAAPEDDGAATWPEGPEPRLEAASAGLQQAEIRDDIADALLAYGAPFLRRRLLLIRRKDQIVGWRAEGDGVAGSVRELAFGAQEPSVLNSLTQPDSFWLGPLPALPANQKIVAALGGSAPSACLVLPVVLRSRVVCYLYGDNAGDGVSGAPLPQLKRLVGKAGLAFEVYILRNKIRLL